MYLPRLPTFNPGERALVGAWKAYLKWEESNPLEIEDKDRATFITRMQGVYRKAVIRMRYFAEIWCVPLYISLAPLIRVQVHGLCLDEWYRKDRGSTRDLAVWNGGKPFKVRSVAFADRRHSYPLVSS